MYQIFFAPDGSRQHELNRFSHLQYWNDACWHRSVPSDTHTLTYLDVGSHAGYFCLRFEQRGGAAVGLDYYLSKIVDDANEVSHLGQEHTDSEYLWVKDRYKCSYRVFVGGFDRDGKLVPDLGTYNIISSMNVLEYLPNPKECISEMFAKATDRVIINLDVDPSDKTKPIHDLWPMKWLCGLKDILSWIPWPCVYWIYDIGDEGHSRYQLFLVATHPESSLGPVDGRPIEFDKECDLPHTEKFYRANR